MSKLRLALCQMNATVGDLAGNSERIRAGIDAGRKTGAQVVLFPELALSGYPPEDLLLRAHFLEDTEKKLQELAGETEGIVAIVGFPERGDAGVYNSAAVLAHGTVHTIYRKVRLPNYGVFDEQRYFKAGEAGGAVIDIGAHEVGITVCEDLWVAGAPATSEAIAGASLIVNISASPYHAGKGLERERLFAQRAKETGAHIAFCAMVGGQDELVFDGQSFVLDQAGQTLARASQFTEDLLVCDLFADEDEQASRPLRAPIASREQEVYEALLLGLHDYVEKNGFGSVVLGLSGGIDSALVACLAADALGAERVNVAIMPSPYSSSATQEDARMLARALGLSTHELTIEPVMDAYTQTLQADFEALEADLTEENLQARIRGNLLMALSNKFGWLVLTTGNKSEMSVGYTTLYGDLAGGFAVIKDVPKTLVYRLARWRNDPSAAQALDNTGITPASITPASAPIPASIIERAPSAELRDNQTDQDSLPPYELLDRILHGYIELDRSREQLIAEGLPRTDVERAARLVDLAEYKRRQAPPGIKITERAFGRDRRMPITNAYRG
ncbi:MAG TPA: NAD+ synthase [Solirubrobacteraceae bacterium]|jgi:NAD+ synthase (glutamine-hydrolysing)